MNGKCTKKSDIKQGLKDGLPIGLGYFSVSFAFGLSTVSAGFAIWQALLISMTNLTSAGQLAGVTLMAAFASFVEIALAQLVINIRYSLMSISLSQKLDETFRTRDRFLLSAFITDEIFAVASSYSVINRTYMRSLAILPYFGWSLGTLAGAVLGELLPAELVSSLGIAIYGMFIAIIIPPSKKSKSVLGVVVTAASLSCIIHYTPISEYISSGFSIIICAIITSLIFAALFPLKETEENADE
ncbi:MAG: AzlC family ABC transporter permease [Ruminococcaceae bacterium]|nr:AzlC family ABC transporter permease [Oscillospiraceae bacterium]